MQLQTLSRQMPCAGCCVTSRSPTVCRIRVRNTTQSMCPLPSPSKSTEISPFMQCTERLTKALPDPGVRSEVACDVLKMDAVEIHNVRSLCPIVSRLSMMGQLEHGMSRACLPYSYQWAIIGGLVNHYLRFSWQTFTCLRRSRYSDPQYVIELADWIAFQWHTPHCA